jgi:hypothetical protein
MRRTPTLAGDLALLLGRHRREPASFLANWLVHGLPPRDVGSSRFPARGRILDRHRRRFVGRRVGNLVGFRSVTQRVVFRILLYHF